MVNQVPIANFRNALESLNIKVYTQTDAACGPMLYVFYQDVQGKFLVKLKKKREKSGKKISPSQFHPAFLASSDFQFYGTISKSFPRQNQTWRLLNIQNFLESEKKFVKMALVPTNEIKSVCALTNQRVPFTRPTFA